MKSCSLYQLPDPFSQIDHRPWPLPERRWLGRQQWLDLAFFHWKVDVELIRAQLPEGLEVDLFEGEAWISVVPFRMTDVMLRGVPGIPGVSNFPELNVRTYVTRNGKPGVWFFSLDATKPLAVWAAKAFFHLPYFTARMECSGYDEIQYNSVRSEDGGAFEATYRPTGEVFESEVGSIEEWLSERYCLYAESKKGDLFCGEVQHVKWPLQEVEYEITKNSLAERVGIPLSCQPDLAHFARGVDVRVWAIEPC